MQSTESTLGSSTPPQYSMALNGIFDHIFRYTEPFRRFYIGLVATNLSFPTTVKSSKPVRCIVRYGPSFQGPFVFTYGPEIQFTDIIKFPGRSAVFCEDPREFSTILYRFGKGELGRGALPVAADDRPRPCVDIEPAAAALYSKYCSINDKKRRTTILPHDRISIDSRGGFLGFKAIQSLKTKNTVGFASARASKLFFPR